MDSSEYFTSHHDETSGLVKVGRCPCKPAAAAYVTTRDMPLEYTFVCGNRIEHNWSSIKLVPQLARLDPESRSRNTTRRIFTAFFEGWHNDWTAAKAEQAAAEEAAAEHEANKHEASEHGASEHEPDSLDDSKHQSATVLNVPYQANPRDMLGTFTGPDESTDGEESWKGLPVVLYRQPGSVVRYGSNQAIGKSQATRMAYQLWHLFKAVATHPKTLSNVGCALYAWTRGDAPAAQAVLNHFILAELPPWMYTDASGPVLAIFASLLTNAIARRVFMRHYNDGVPGLAHLIKEGDIAFRLMLQHAHEVPPVESHGAIVLRNADRARRNGSTC